MAETLGDAVLVLRTDDSQLDSGIAGAETKARALSGTFQQTAASTERLSQELTDASRAASASGVQFGRTGTIVANSAAQSRQGLMVMGEQLRQVGTELALGVSPAQVFAQQIGQVTYAVQLMGGEANAFTKFLGGPWGIALSVGVSVLAPFIAKLFEAQSAADAMGAAADRAVSKLKNLANESLGQARAELADANLQILNQQGLVNNLERRANQPTFQGAALRQQLADAKDKLADARMAANAAAIQIRNRARYEPSGGGGGTSGGGGGGGGFRGGSGRSAAGATAVDQAQKALDLERQRAGVEQDRLTLDERLADLRATGLEADAKQADYAEADYQLKQQFPDLASSTNKADQDLLATLTAQKHALIDQQYARDDLKKTAQEQAEFGELFDQISEKSAEDAKRAQDELAQRQEQQIRTLAGLYEDLFKHGTKGIADDFKQIMFGVLAQLAAQFTLSLFSKGGAGGFSLGSALGQAIGAILPGFGGGRAGGGSVSPGQFYTVNERSTAPGLFIPLAPGVIEPPNSASAAGARAPAMVEIAVQAGQLFEPTITRISGDVAIRTVQATAPTIRDVSVAETMRQLGRPRM